MRILFIGNSHTFAHGLPYQVRGMVNGTVLADLPPEHAEVLQRIAAE